MKTRLAAIACCLALGAAAGLHGCAGDRASVQVQSICWPTEDCAFSSMCEQYLHGVPGINGTGTLVLYLQVANQLPNNENLGEGRLNTNDAHVEEIAIEYEGVQTNTAREGANSYVPAGGSAVLPVALGITATGNILAKVRLIGHYDDGTGFETGEFPISVFAGAGACPPTPCAAAATTCPPGGAAQCPVACEASGSAPGTFSVGGTITGLTASGLTLQSPGLADVSVPAGAGTFEFTNVPDGTAYNVTVRTQPAPQTCTVTANGTGTVSGANVTNIRIDCL